MADRRLPLRVTRLSSGYAVRLADGRAAAFVYYREDETVARAAAVLTQPEAEDLAKEIARLLTDAWGGK